MPRHERTWLLIQVGGIERTRAQWESLLNEAGLNIIEVVNYDQDYGDSVIIAGLPAPNDITLMGTSWSNRLILS